eukprot:COSAG01_NODE_6411_length_3680_cov_2.270874_2_plen_72_part_00
MVDDGRTVTIVAARVVVCSNPQQQGWSLPVGMVSIGYLGPFWRLAGYGYSWVRVRVSGFQGPAGADFINIP